MGVRGGGLEVDADDATVKGGEEVVVMRRRWDANSGNDNPRCKDDDGLNTLMEANDGGGMPERAGSHAAEKCFSSVF